MREREKKVVGKVRKKEAKDTQPLLTNESIISVESFLQFNGRRAAKRGDRRTPRKHRRKISAIAGRSWSWKPIDRNPAPINRALILHFDFIISSSLESINQQYGLHEWSRQLWDINEKMKVHWERNTLHGCNNDGWDRTMKRILPAWTKRSTRQSALIRLGDGFDLEHRAKVQQLILNNSIHSFLEF